MRDIEGLLAEEVNEKKKVVTTHIRVPVSTKEILMKRAEKRGLSVSQCTKELVEKYIFYEERGTYR